MTSENFRETARPRASELLGRGWLNIGGVDLSLEDLRGKIVILDFWTFCCVNCLHVLDELRPLEEKWSQEVVVIGVHSPKFTFERDRDALVANINRYGVEHPVLDDPDLRTWSEYGAKAWPTLMVLDTHGRIAASMSGEGHAANLDGIVARLVSEGESDGSLVRGDAPTVLEQSELHTLRFPSKGGLLPDGRIIVSDAGQNRLVVFEADGVTVDEIIGSGERGWADGSAAEAQFSQPNGIAVLPPEIADQVGYDLVIADTGNHRLRGVQLGRRRLLRPRIESHVFTLAGNGEQWMQGQALPTGTGTPIQFALSTPWDVEWDDVSGQIVIAMAGIHQMWTYRPAALNDDGEFVDVGALEVLAGTTQEGLVDGALVRSWWAQPSGVTVDANGTVFVADAETSAVRVIAADRGEVSTLVGEGLFDFGHVDGPLEKARLQHPLGITVLVDGRLAVADTYNGAVRIIDPIHDSVVTVATGLSEPSDLIVVDPIDGLAQLIVVESGAHRLTWISISPAAEQIIDEGAQRTERPTTAVSNKVPLTVEVAFTPPEGHKLDDSFGPSTQVSISTTPAAMLVSGGGTSSDLVREIELDPSYAEGVIHVNARAASCDADPTIEFPACHMHQQDWGVPVKLTEKGTRTLLLSLLA
ncbi:redoxin domain-containing protein [Dermabacter sp. p3-SID358]|uniref:thioredoxin-like domain-containing protein n=1 Tax=Dermabacter sp. p3-SID358 TaxID=2916114 RepID=UPI0021A6D82A|nr:thioredoxin-like domain-containing protein [Dermabacter sp. p3-SID358]MCT1867476.1 redoxin domain-containing protein [Dermabacter sp. p3-SID358]